MQRLNDVVQGLAVLIVFLLLVTHDLSNWNSEDTDKLSREALEDFIVDTAGHRWGIQVVDRHGYLEADDGVDGWVWA